MFIQIGGEMLLEIINVNISLEDVLVGSSRIDIKDLLGVCSYIHVYMYIMYTYMYINTIIYTYICAYYVYICI